MDRPGVRLSINPRTGAGVIGDVEAMHWMEIVAGLKLEPRFQKIISLGTDPAPEQVGDDGPSLRPSSRSDETWPSPVIPWIPRKASSGVDLIFHPFAVPALFSSLPQAVLLSPTPAARSGGLAGRLAWAAAKAALANADLRFVYGDSSADGGMTTERLAPWVSPLFASDPGSQPGQDHAGLTGGRPYLLCHGLNPRGGDMLSAAWSWVAGSVGDEYALLILGASATTQSRMWDWAGEHGWQANLCFTSCTELDALRDVYQQAFVFLQIDPILSGQGLRWAQASGIPIVGFARGPAAMITGSAGYLVSEGDARQLGAAILTLLVEEGLHQELRGRGLEQSRRYLQADLPGELAARFQSFQATR